MCTEAVETLTQYRYPSTKVLDANGKAVEKGK
ncbi:hypothetical protein O999_00040 [Pseudomonas putida LF54]|nr:hypothetical protein O999_00040 [Pseudomonas putida LF54]